MLKLFLLLLCFWIVVTLLKKYKISVEQPKPDNAIQDLVPCAVCHTYIARQENACRNGLYYCEQHLPRN